jgi:hypothetical protein
MGKQTDHIVTCAGQTVGAVQAALCSYDLPNDCVALIEVALIGRDIGNGDGYVAKKVLAFKQVAGVGVQIGNTSDAFAPVASQALLAASVAATIASATISISATGIAGRTIDWYATLKVTFN